MDPASTILLGPQRLRPTLIEALDERGVSGPVATITAGWQERESDDAELHRHLRERSVNLRLHARAEAVFGRDPEFARAHRERQDTLRVVRELYRQRLVHARAACQAVLRRAAPPQIRTRAYQGAIAAVRALDAEHLDLMREIRREFDERWRPAEREAVARERRELAGPLERCAALAVAGGHVAVLLNRLRLFGLDVPRGALPVFAWSAGAMIMAERVVLFHDSPPQGAGDPEVFDDGLGFAPAIVPLPHARRRLALDDRERVELFARRFAPARAVIMDDGARVEWRGGRWAAAWGAAVLGDDGGLRPLDAAAGPRSAEAIA